MTPFLSKGAILTWAGGGGGRPSLAPKKRLAFRMSDTDGGAGLGVKTI